MNKKIIGLALGAFLFALSVSAEAQQPSKVPKIGYLGGRRAPHEVRVRNKLENRQANRTDYTARGVGASESSNSLIIGIRNLMAYCNEY